jgi:hypothetical protein
MPANPQPASLKGKVLRSFYYKGEPLKVGSEHELPRQFAREQVSLKRFELSPAPAPAPAADAPKADAKKGAK